MQCESAIRKTVAVAAAAAIIAGAGMASADPNIQTPGVDDGVPNCAVLNARAAAGYIGTGAPQPSRPMDENFAHPPRDWCNTDVGYSRLSFGPKGATFSVPPTVQGLFPYNNCYHWFEAKAVNVRVRARPEEFDETGAVKLNARSRIQMQRYWIEDGSRLPDISEEPETKHDPIDSSGVAASGFSEPTLSSSSQNPCEDTTRSESMVAARAQCPPAWDDDESASMISSGSSTLEDKSNHSLEDIAAMGIFSGPNDDVELIPLVDLWISELADHLPQDDIPSQFEMFAEFEEVAK